MRDLKLPALYKGNPLFTTEEDFDEARDIRRLSGRIISAASAIDQVMAEIIMNTIFHEVRDHRELVFGSVLSSDWCSFASKRKLLLIAIEKFDLLHGKEKSDLEKNLSQVIKYRNAFAHGTLAHNMDTQELHYFESRPKSVSLDDAYFEILEQDFLAVWDTLQIMQNKASKLSS